jgi:hypothetical protein
MVDYISETSVEQLQNRLDDEKYARDRFLGGSDLDLVEESMHWIVNHIDCFVSQSRGNRTVTDMICYPYARHGYDEEVWDKVGQAIGNLQALEGLQISIHKFHDDDDDDDEVVPIPDWDRLACILRRIR